MGTGPHRARSVAGLAILSMLAAAGAAAQDKPDFSGTWVLADAAGPSPDAARRLTVTMTVLRDNVRGEPIGPFFDTLTVTREFPTGLRPDSYRIGIEGGTVGGAVGAACTSTRYSVRWDGNRLVIETGSYPKCTRDAGPYTEHTEVWELDAAGVLTVSTTDRSADAEPRRNTSTYRRN